MDRKQERNRSTNRPPALLITCGKPVRNHPKLLTGYNRQSPVANRLSIHPQFSQQEATQLTKLLTILLTIWPLYWAKNEALLVTFFEKVHSKQAIGNMLKTY